MIKNEQLNSLKVKANKLNKIVQDLSKKRDRIDDQIFDIEEKWIVIKRQIEGIERKAHRDPDGYKELNVQEILRDFERDL